MEMLSGGATKGGGSAVGGASYPTAMSIFFHVVAFLFVLVLLQRCLPRWWKPFALTTPELSVIYAAVSIGTAVAGGDTDPDAGNLGNQGNDFSPPTSIYGNQFKDGP